MCRERPLWHAYLLRTVVCTLSAMMVWSSSAVWADEYGLAAPDDWGGETIRLPPGFAPRMDFTGVEHIRFAPGMMRPESPSFFSYAFVFELGSKPDLTAEVIETEFLKYYRGLCKAVLGSQAATVDPETFTLKLKRLPNQDADRNDSLIGYSGVLTWVEPFRTKEAQKLNLEIHVWREADRRFLFACVSPKPTTDKIWTELRVIRRGYQQKRASESTEE